MSQDLSATYAALILADEGLEISVRTFQIRQEGDL